MRELILSDVFVKKYKLLAIRKCGCVYELINPKRIATTTSRLIFFFIESSIVTVR